MPKKTVIDEVVKTDIDDIINAVQKDIKKDFSVFEYDENYVQEFLSTGNVGINYAISGQFDGGFPIGLMTEIAGENSTGKSLLAQHALVETQKQGGIAVLVDSERAYNPKWFQNLGGDPFKLQVFKPSTIEQAYDYIFKIIDSVRAKSDTVKLTIVYDSVAASPSEYEMGKHEKGVDLADTHDMGKRAQAHGKALRFLPGIVEEKKVTLITINQYRSSFAMFGPDVDTVGGKAWKYFTSVRIGMSKGKAIEGETVTGKKKIGIRGKIKVVKSRITAPFAESEFDIYFDSGINPISGLFDVLKNSGTIEPATSDEGKISKGWWQYKDKKFRESQLSELLDEFPELLGGHSLDEFREMDVTVVDSDEDAGSAKEADM